MATLKDVLHDSARRAAIVDDGVRLVDSEVAAKSGFSGLAVKGAFALVKAIKPSMIKEAVDRLLEPFIDQLSPFYEAYQKDSGGQTLADYLQGRAQEIAEALLQVTDERAKKADNRTLKGAYDKLRPAGIKHVAAAVPGIAGLLTKHAPV